MIVRIGIIIALLCCIPSIATAISDDKPFKVNAEINGITPGNRIPVVTPGKINTVRVIIDTPGEGIMISNVVFGSYPTAVGRILNNVAETEYSLPYKTYDLNKIEEIYLPSYTPNGFYEITIRINYKHKLQPFTETHKITVNVESGGILSSLFGLLNYLLPDYFMRKLIDLLLWLFY